MGGVGAVLTGRADGLDQFLAVVGELENGVPVVVDEPDVLFRVVGADEDGVRATPLGVVLGPAFGDFALGVDDDEVVLPLGVDAEFTGVEAEAVFGDLAGAAVGGRGGEGGVAHGHAAFADGKGEAGADLGHAAGLGLGNVGQLAALEDEDAVGTFGEDAFHRAPGPLLVAGEGGEILGPIGDRLVGAEGVLTADFAGDGGDAGGRGGAFRVGGGGKAGEQEDGDESEDGG